MRYLLTIVVLALGLSAVQANELVTRKNDIGHRNFTRAKTLLPHVFQGLNQTFYCGCSYTDKTINLKSCGYQVRKDERRANRMEWEHVILAWVLGHQRQCWQKGGRSYCAKNDPVYAKAEGDMHNLVPAIGEINNDRSNYGFSVWTRSIPSTYGQCEMVVDFKGRRVQPPAAVRGKIARISFYMANQYHLRMSPQERRLYCVWAKAYPVDQWEQLRNRRVAAIQGNVNPFVSQPELIDRVCK